jgi:Caspase domain
MYLLLKKLGYEILDNHKLIGYVKFETMRRAIYDFFDNRKTESNDLLVFYYSGHGIPTINGDDVCLASSEIDPDYPKIDGLVSSDLTKCMKDSDSSAVVAILDCCYSGAAGISKGHEDDAAKIGTAAIENKAKILEDPQQQGEGRCLLAASQATQEAYHLIEKDHSIFTYYLLEGLRENEKSVDVDGNVTPPSLGSYIHKAILKLPAKKRPKQKPIIKVEASGDIVLASYPNLAKHNTPTPSSFNDPPASIISPIISPPGLNSQSRVDEKKDYLKLFSKSKILMLAIAVIIGSLMVVVFSGGLIHQPFSPPMVTKPSSTQPPILNDLTYKNSTYGVKIQYPSNWKIYPGASLIGKNGQLIPINFSIAFIVPPNYPHPLESDRSTYFELGMDQLTPADTKNIDLYLRNIINDRSNETGFHLVSADFDSTLAGRRAYSLVYTYIERGFNTTAIETGTFVGNRNYWLLFTAEAAKFDSFVPTVQKMINSFEINARQSNKEPTIVEGPQSKIAGNATLLQSNGINPTLTPRPDNLNYENATYGIKIQYPSSWGVQPGRNLLGPNGQLLQPITIAYISPPIESDPNATAYFQIGQRNPEPDEVKNLGLYLRDTINSYRSNNTRFHLASASANTTLAGKQAYSLVFTDTYQGFNLKTIETGTLVDNKIYYVSFSSEPGKFDRFLPTVQKMISSFAIKSK